MFAQIHSLRERRRLIGFAAIGHAQNANPPAAATGKAAFGSWRDDAPGKRRHITADALPAPERDALRRQSGRVVAKPHDAQLKVPAGFEVKQFASGLEQSAPDAGRAERRHLRRRKRSRPHPRAAPDRQRRGRRQERNFRVGSQPSVRHRVLSAPTIRNGSMSRNTDSVVRFPYRRPATSRRAARAEVIVPKLPTGGSHWTRDVVFSKDGTQDVRLGRLRLQCRRRHGQARRRGAAASGSRKSRSAPPGATRPSAPTCWSSIPQGKNREGLRHRHPQLRRHGDQSRPPATSGARPTSATRSATISFPITSRA